MEKKEAVREYCIDRVVELYLSNKTAIDFTVEDVIKSAEILEEYIGSPAKKSRTDI